MVGGKAPGDLTAEQQSETLEELIGMYAGAQEAEKQKMELLRVRFDEQMRAEKRKIAGTAIESQATGKDV